MAGHGAAPVSGITGSGKINDGNALSIADAVGPVFAARLAAENVYTFADWRRLGRRRLQIFGITPRVVAQLDRAAESAA